MDPKIVRIIDGFEKMGKWGVRGLTAEIARGTGFSASYIAQVFKGNKVPADKFIISVCDAFGISKRWANEGLEPVFNDVVSRKLAQKAVDIAEFSKTIKGIQLSMISEHLEESYEYLKALGGTSVCIEGYKELQKMTESNQYRAVAILKEMNAGSDKIKD